MLSLFVKAFIATKGHNQPQTTGKQQAKSFVSDVVRGLISDYTLKVKRSSSPPNLFSSRNKDLKWSTKRKSLDGVWKVPISASFSVLDHRMSRFCTLNNQKCNDINVNRSPQQNAGGIHPSDSKRIKTSFPLNPLVRRSASSFRRKEGRTPPAGSHDAVGDVLEGVVELGGDGAHGPVHQLLHQNLQLLLGQGHVETLLQAADGAGAVEAGQVGAWRGTKRSRFSKNTSQNLFLLAFSEEIQREFCKQFISHHISSAFRVWNQSFRDLKVRLWSSFHPCSERFQCSFNY